MTCVQIGLKCEYIMRALLAVSSLHLAHHRPETHGSYLSLAMHHHQIATTEVSMYMIEAPRVPGKYGHLYIKPNLVINRGQPA